MKKTFAQIQQQIHALQREAEKLRSDEVAEVVAKIKEAIEIYGLTAADLGLASLRGPRKASKAAAVGKKRRAAKKASVVKYRDAQGRTWGGRGPRPQWLRDAIASGKTLEDFAV